MVLDEVQRVPDLLLAIKQAVDEDRPRRRGRFLLTGSANLLLMEKVADSLAGRAGYVTLWPLTRRELLGRGHTGAWDVLLDAPPDGWIARDADLPHSTTRRYLNLLETSFQVIRTEPFAGKVKATARPRPRDWATLVEFRERYGDEVKGCVLLHAGEQVEWVSERVLAVPWWRVVSRKRLGIAPRQNPGGSIGGADARPGDTSGS